MAILSEEGDGEELVHEDAAVLRVVAELDDVPVAVIGFEQMGVGAVLLAFSERAGRR